MVSNRMITELEHIETPFYHYNIDLLTETLKMIKLQSEKFNYRVHYALKANNNDRILRKICSYGLGADCVSGNEVKKALEIGFKPDDIVFAGVGKTDKEIKFALQNKIFSLNCESIAELEVINQIAIEEGVIANVSIRLNPDVDARSHKYISTGLKENKFGVNLADLDKIIERQHIYEGINIIGLHFHVGSQITDMQVYKELSLRINEIQDHLSKLGVHLNHINVGGGLGINYEEPWDEPIPDFEEYFRVFNENLDLRPEQILHFELGRSIVGHCGTLISKVSYVKEGVDKNFVILDAGMNDLLRPALYGSKHYIENLSSLATAIREYDVVGPICETSDSFGENVPLSYTKRGDIVAIFSTGAYGQTMTSNYNLRDMIPAVYSDEMVK
jgi:diaminopimelate decarboxylase